MAKLYSMIMFAFSLIPKDTFSRISNKAIGESKLCILSIIKSMSICSGTWKWVLCAFSIFWAKKYTLRPKLTVFSIPLLINFQVRTLQCIVDATTLSGILKAKQKLGVTFNSDKLGGIDFTKFSKLSMCSAGAGQCWLVQWPGLPPRHSTWSVLKFL